MIRDETERENREGGAITQFRGTYGSPKGMKYKEAGGDGDGGDKKNTFSGVTLLSKFQFTAICLKIKPHF